MKKYVLKIRPGHLPNFSSSGSYVFWESITKLPIIFISIVAVCLCISTTSFRDECFYGSIRRRGAFIK